MDCFLQVTQTGKCVACHRVFEEGERGTPVRIQNEHGFSLSAMCGSCLDKVIKHREEKKMTFGV